MRELMISLVLMTVLSACGSPQEKSVRVAMETGKGEIVVELYPDKAPVTVANFLKYVDGGHYDGARFYRTTRPDNDPMIEVIQGGVWPVHEEDFEAPFPNIAHETTAMTGLSHIDGALSMARNEPGTASSEFFISVGANPELDFGGERNPDGQGFAVFGQVVEGLDVVRAINAAPTDDGEGFEGQLLTEPVIITTMSRR